MFGSRSSPSRRSSYRADSDPLVGSEVGGDFLIRKVLARGGESVAYLAAQKSVADREVVVKTPDKAFWILSSRDKHREGNPYLKELRIASITRHAAFAHIYAAGELSDGRPFIAMEYLRGPTLRDYLRDEGAVAPKMAIELVGQLCSAVRTLHMNNVLYRDIKPSHIILQPDQGLGPQVRLLDLGAAQTTYQRDSNARFAEGQAIGSPGYTSPELARGKPGDERSDVFSLAAVVYEMLAGVPAIHIEQSSSERLLRYVLTDRAPLPTHPLSRVNPEFPAQLDAVLARGLERRPRRRYATVPAFQSALVDALALLSGGGGDDSMLGRLREILEKPLW